MFRHPQPSLLVATDAGDPPSNEEITRDRSGCVEREEAHEERLEGHRYRTGLLMLGTAIGTLGVQAQTNPQPDQAHG